MVGIRMKIAVVHSYYASESASGENAVVDAQIEALKRAGHSVSLLARRTDDAGRLKVARGGFTTLTGLGPSPHGDIARFDPDIIHVHNLFPNWGQRWLSNQAAPIVATIHNYRTICSAGTLYREGAECTACPSTGSSLPSIKHACYRGSRPATLPLTWQTRSNGTHNALLRNARRLITLSERSAGILSSYIPLPIQLSLVPNFTPAATSSSPTDRAGWLYVGRLTDEKGIAQLLAAWPASEPLTVIGTGPLAPLVTAHCQRDPKSIYLGRLDERGVRDAMSRAEGLVFPSRWAEGLPTVFLEALSEGLPVIALAGSSVGDAVRSRRFGFTMRNLDQLAEAMRYIRSQTPRLNELAREEHARQYSESAWLARVTDVYQGVIAS